MTLATVAEADREWARNVGIAIPDRAWILSDRDVWYANPAYSGPPVPHPEEGYISPEEAAAILAEAEAAEEEHAAWKRIHASDPAPARDGADADFWDDDIPF